MFRQKLDDRSARVIQIETAVFHIGKVENFRRPLAQLLCHVCHWLAFLVLFFGNTFEYIGQFPAFYIPDVFITDKRKEM